MSHELIEKIQACSELKVINNPFIKAFKELAAEKQEVIAIALTDNNVALWDEKGVNKLELLPYLWPQLTDKQKKDMASSVRFLFEGHGLRIVGLILKEDVDLIFADYDLKKLKWAWKDIQFLMALFSTEEQSKHLERYFENCLRPFSQEKWQAFLEPLREEERYWVFKHLPLNALKIFFAIANIDFLFSQLSDSYKVAILQRLDKDFFFRHLKYEYKDLLHANFICFLKKFNPEHWKTVYSCLSPEQLQSIINPSLNLLKTLELFPETDRLDLLQYLGHEFLKKIGGEEGEDISFELAEICRFLPAEHRIPFLTGFDSAYLQSMNDSWDNIARVTNNLTSDEDAIFFQHMGLYVIEQFFIKQHIELIVEKVNEEKQLGFLSLINRLFPELLGNIFVADLYNFISIIKLLSEKERFSFIALFSAASLDKIFFRGRNADPYNFISVTKLLPKEDQFSFFALFSENNLRKLQNNIQYNKKNSALLRRYLDTKNSNQLPANASVARRPALPKNVGCQSSLFVQPPSIAKQEIPTVPPIISMLPRKTSPNYFEALDAKIEELAINESHQHLYASLVELRAAIALQFAKECRHHQNEANYWARFSLKPVVDATVSFLTDFLNDDNSHMRVVLIENYEHDIQPAKTLKTVGKCLAIFIIAALCMATGAVFGAGLGLLIGCGTGPGSIVTGFAGLFAGAHAGAMIASVVTSGVLAGVVGAAAGLAFFKPSPVERAKGQVVHELEKNYTRNEKIF